VVDFRPIAAPTPACRAATLARVTGAAFGQRRKMLRSSLKQLTPMAELLLREAGIDPQRRAEDLSVAEFANLAAILDRGDWERA
jgi:16S rRNA (adenine1518-N6/adenine1519-N6)-dimethyltransferase